MAVPHIVSGKDGMRRFLVGEVGNVGEALNTRNVNSKKRLRKQIADDK